MKIKISIVAILLGFCLFGNARAYQNVDCDYYGNTYDCAQIRSDQWCVERTGDPQAICSAECGLFCARMECSGEEFFGEFTDAYSYNPGDMCACGGGRVLKCPDSRENDYSSCGEHVDASCVFYGESGTMICGRAVDGAPDSHLCYLCGVSSGTSTTSASTYINETVTTTCSVSNYVVSASISNPTYKCKSNAYGTATSATAGCYKCPDNATCNGGTTFTCNAGWYKSGDTCTQCPETTITYPDGSSTKARGTSSAGTTSVTGCYVASGTYYDASGTKTVGTSCTYKTGASSVL